MTDASDVPSGGSRTFANALIVTWTPSANSVELDVTICGSGVLLCNMTFTPYDSSQSFTFATSSEKGCGSFEADFSADGKSGTLNSRRFRWVANGQRGHFVGTIGTWPSSSSPAS